MDGFDFGQIDDFGNDYEELMRVWEEEWAK